MSRRRSYGYIAKRCHDYLRSRQPIMYAQTQGAVGYVTDVVDELGIYMIRYMSSGRLCIYDRLAGNGPRRELVIMDHGKVIRMAPEPDSRAILFDDFLPALEAALVLQDLSEI